MFYFEEAYASHIQFIYSVSFLFCTTISYKHLNVRNQALKSKNIHTAQVISRMEFDWKLNAYDHQKLQIEAHIRFWWWNFQQNKATSLTEVRFNLSQFLCNNQLIVIDFVCFWTFGISQKRSMYWTFVIAIALFISLPFLLCPILSLFLLHDSL